MSKFGFEKVAMNANGLRLSAADDSNHAPPPDASIHFQESWCLFWYDPIQRLGGFHHTGAQRVRREADAWSWIAHRGDLIHQYHNNELALPADDYTDLVLGPFHLRTKAPLTHRLIDIEDGGLQAHLEYRDLFGEAVPVSYHSGGGEIGEGYVQAGRVRGAVQVRDRKLDVNALAFQDRTWGPRNWKDMYAYHWLWACLGDELVTSLYHVVGPDGTRDLGYIFDNGKLRDVVALESIMEMSGDGVTPSGARAVAWASDGSGYRLTGKCDGAGVQRHRDGFMMSNACVLWTMGGRVATGFIEVCELKKPNSALTKQLQAAARPGRTRSPG